MNKQPHLATIKECTGCFGCIQVCPQKAITACENKEGHYSVRINESKCIGCLKCETFCKGYRSKYGNNDINLTQFFAGWALDDMLRKNATSGGIFAAVATTFVKNGGAVVASKLENNLCHFCLVNKIQDITSLQGSKYVQSNIIEAYNLVDSVIDTKPVLFVGTGCQCAAVLTYFKSKREKLYTIDLVCGGVPTNFLTEKFLQSNEKIDEIQSYRSKTKYQLTYSLKNGTIESDSDSLPIRAFSRETTNRYSCYNCQFAFIHRNSDLTIGDIWGCDLYDKDAGVSLVLKHSKRGMDLLKQAAIMLSPIEPYQILRGNTRIFYGKNPIPIQRRFLSILFNRLSYSHLNVVFGEKGSVYNPLLLFLKSYKHLLYILEKKRALRQIDKIVVKNK